jgi:hypothetical protein
MKTAANVSRLLAMAVGAAWLGASSLLAADAGGAAPRVGVYDSRVVAYAHFSTSASQRTLNDAMRSAKEAKAAGDTQKFEKLRAALREQQDRIHLQVFSTAPIDEVLTEMSQRVAEVKKTARVTLLVSQWDTKSLEQHQGAAQVDVTDDLLREFQLSDKQQQVVQDLRNKPPLPLDEAKKLVKENKL